MTRATSSYHWCDGFAKNLSWMEGSYATSADCELRGKGSLVRFDDVASMLSTKDP